MSSASQLLYGSTQGRNQFFEPPAPWTPAQLFVDGTTQGFWIDPSDESTLTASGGGAASVGDQVASIANKGTTPPNFSLYSGSGAFLRAGISTRYLEFNANSTIYRQSTTLEVPNYKMYMAMACVPKTGSTAGVLGDFRYSDQPEGNAQFLLNSATADAITGNGRTTTDAYIGATVSLSSPGVNTVTSFKIDGDTNVVTTYANGTTSTNTGANYVPATGRSILGMIGGRDSIGSLASERLYTNSDIYEVVAIYGRLPTPEEENALHNYLNRHF